MIFKIKIFFWRIYIFLLGKKERQFIIDKLLLYKKEYINQNKDEYNLGFKGTCHFLKGFIPRRLHRLVGKHFGGNLDDTFWWNPYYDRTERDSFEYYTEDDPRVKLFNYLIELYERGRN